MHFENFFSCSCFFVEFSNCSIRGDQLNLPFLCRVMYTSSNKLSIPWNRYSPIRFAIALRVLCMFVHTIPSSVCIVLDHCRRSSVINFPQCPQSTSFKFPEWYMQIFHIIYRLRMELNLKLTKYFKCLKMGPQHSIDYGSSSGTNYGM